MLHVKENIKVPFNWARVRLFDRMAVTILFERCIRARTAQVTKMQKKPTSKWKPLPLTTVELQKMGSRFLRMDSQRVMTVAEHLYNKGWISYPRTETDQFDRGMNLLGIIEKQHQDGRWGGFAQSCVNAKMSIAKAIIDQWTGSLMADSNGPETGATTTKRILRFTRSTM